MTALWDPQFEAISRRALRFLTEDAVLTPDLDTTAAGLDSLTSGERLASVEEAYGITIPDHLLTAETFASPGALWPTISHVWEERAR